MSGVFGRFLLKAFVAAVLLFMIAPTAVIVLYSLFPSAYITFPPQSLTFAWYVDAFSQRSLFLDPLLTSLKLSLTAMLASSCIGTLAAFALVRGRFPLQAAVRSLLLAPLMVPTLIVGLGGMMFLISFGWLGSYAGLLLGHVVITVPFVIQAVTASLENLDRNQEEAAVSLGSPPLRAIRRVVLPVIVPGIFAGAVFGWIISFDELPLTLLLSTPTTVTLPVQLYGYLQQRSDPTFAAIAVILLLISFAALVVMQKAGGVDKRVY